MSIKAMSAAFEAGSAYHLSAIDRLILLRIGDWADDYGYAWPGISTDLVGMVGVDERTIRRHITALAEQGLVERVYDGGGRNRPTLYRILPNLLPDAPDAPGRLRYEDRFLNGDRESPFNRDTGTVQTRKGDTADRKRGRSSVPRSVNDPSLIQDEFQLMKENPKQPHETQAAYAIRLGKLRRSA